MKTVFNIRILFFMLFLAGLNGCKKYSGEVPLIPDLTEGTAIVPLSNTHFYIKSKLDNTDNLSQWESHGFMVKITNLPNTGIKTYYGADTSYTLVKTTALTGDQIDDTLDFLSFTREYRIIPFTANKSTIALGRAKAVKPSPVRESTFTNYPMAVKNPFSFNDGNNIYVGGGDDGPGNNVSRFFRYNVSAGTWDSLANFPGLYSRGGCSFANAQNGYVVTGFRYPDASKECWKYNFASGTWTQMPDFPGMARENASFVVKGSKAYVLYGVNRSATQNNLLDDVWSFDLNSETWEQHFPTGEKPSPRHSASAFCINNIMYMACGNVNPTGEEYLPEFYQLNLDNMVWTRKANLNFRPQQSFGAAVEKSYLANGKGLGFVGMGSMVVNGSGAVIMCYNPDYDKWYVYGEISLITTDTQRFDMFCEVLGSKIYFGAGGAYANAYNDCYLLNTGL